MTGGEKALERICPSHPPFVLCPARLWSLRGLNTGLSGKPGVSWHGAELCKVPFLLCHCFAAQLLATPLTSLPVLAGVLFLAAFLVGHLLNNICISYLMSPPSLSPLAATMQRQPEVRLAFVFLPLLWMFSEGSKTSFHIVPGNKPSNRQEPQTCRA